MHVVCDDHAAAPSCQRSVRAYRVRIIDFEELGSKFDGAPVSQNLTILVVSRIS